MRSILFTNLVTSSIKSALREQGLLGLYRRLIDIVPDITHQYSDFKIDSKYILTKVKAQHSFQISLANRAIELIDNKGDNEELKIIDIGDSFGTHLQYIKALWPKRQIRAVSVNLDNNAVQRIRQKGLEAVCCRAEDIEKYSHSGTDIFLSFEMLEHLIDPIEFLYKLSTKTNGKLFVVTVPYLKTSRVGLRYIRSSNKKISTAENTHIFELSPEDWKLLFQFTGWRVMFEKTYLQYPRRHWMRLTQPYWKKFDFEGFYGVILKRDNSWVSQYQDW